MNARQVKPHGVKITLLDGVERELLFTLNALAELEEKFGSVDAAFAEADKGSIKTIRFVLWAGLITKDPELTEQQVGALIDMRMLANLMQGMTAALGAHMGADEDNNIVDFSVEEVYENPDILPENRGAPLPN